MLAYMLDSNVCIAAMRASDSRLFERFEQHKSQLCMSTVALHELIHGAEKSQRPDHQHGRIAALTSLLEVLEFDANAARHSGQIHAMLSRAGKVIGAYDMLIAGHARSRNLTVVTNNLKEFTRVPGLLCEDWT